MINPNDNLLEKIYHLLSFPIKTELAKAEKSLAEIDERIKNYKFSINVDNIRGYYINKIGFECMLSERKELLAKIKELKENLGDQTND